VWGGYISRLVKVIGLFCKKAPHRKLDSAKETYDFKEPCNCSHPISAIQLLLQLADAISDEGLRSLVSSGLSLFLFADTIGWLRLV